MSDPSPPPVLFIACLSLLFLFAVPQVSHSQVQGWDGEARSPLRGTSATGHLEQMTGQKIGRSQSSGMSRTPMKGMGGMGSMVGMMMLQSIISEALDASAATSQQAAQRAELEAWMKAEKQRLTDLVTQQRGKRELEDKVSIEELRAAMGGQSDGGKPSSDLASALSDPQAVIHNPGGTPFFGSGGGSVSMSAFAVDAVKPTVDLSQRASDAPRIPENQTQASRVQTASAVRQVQLRTQAAKKLQVMIKENQNPVILDKRLQKLEEDLAEVLRQARELQNRFDAIAKDYALYEKTVDSVTLKSIERALSLLVDASGDKLLEGWKNLRYDPDKWNRTLQAMDKINEVATLTKFGIEHAEQSKDIYDDEWKAWNSSSGPGLKEDLDFIFQNLPAEIFGKFSPHYKLGKFMLDTSLDTRKLFVDLKDLQATSKAYLSKQQQIDIKIKSLVKAIKERRQQLASN
jgi:hypothetical protein